MIYLGKAGSHFTASGSGCGDDNQRSGRFDIFVLSVSVIADNQGNVGRIAFDRIMTIHLHTKGFEFLLVSNCGSLVCKMCQADTSDIQSVSAECVNQTKHVHVIGNAKVGTYFVLLNILCGNNDYNLRLVF